MPAGRLLLLGSEGQLGREVAKLAASRGVSLNALPHRALDITDAAGLRRALDQGHYDTVINAAAYTAVDKAESEEDLATKVNRDGAVCVAEACRAREVALIHISTDYVFDGSKRAPYVESDAIAPLGVYGRSKAAGEAAVRERCAQHVILRTSWVFGAKGGNFVKTMLRLGRERRELSVVADQLGCPTPAKGLASAVLAVATQAREAPWGTYHCCGAEPTSWFGFAEAIFAEQEALTGEPGPTLVPIATEDYPTPARRPADSRLDCSAFQSRFGQAAIDWREGLRDVLREIYTAEAIQPAGG